jgi:putative hydrolase of the HAD superfamily
MPHITTIFWDLGGVLLTNAWDHAERATALAKFKIDAADFDSRHATMVAGFERGEFTLDEYLDHTVFYTSRPFLRDEFTRYMFSLSQALADRLPMVRELAKTGRYFMGTINNESRELDNYRIQTFGLRDVFSVFVSSCFVRLRKPDEAIYRCALELTQKSPEECCFIDDRAENLAVPAKLGMKVIRACETQQLKDELAEIGVIAAK